jgi:selenocysteine lyase/cysteine desulfurase
MTYLNTAAEGIPPRAVIEALGQYAIDKQLGMDGRTLHEAQRHALRRAAGQALGMSVEEIGICSCSSEAFNLAAAALRLGVGDEVIINDLDFPAGITPWLPPNSIATTKLWRSRAGALRTEDLTPLLSRRTRVVSLSLISYYNGYRVSLADVATTVRNASSALVVVDVTQALGRMSLNLTDADLVISSTHKWILGMHGGCLVGAPNARRQLWTVPHGGWFNLENAFATDRFDRAVAKPGAASFSVGMPNYPAVYANRAALDYIKSIDIAAIEAHANPLLRACLDGLKALDVELLTPDEEGSTAGILAFRHSRAEHIFRSLHEQRIHVMHQAGRLRVALHGYNTFADVERFLSALHGALRRA